MSWLAPPTREEILTAHPIRMMLRIGAPAVVSSILFSLYNLTDAYWIGRLTGSDSLAAMAGIQSSWPFVWFMISLIAGFAGAAVTALVAQNIGANRPEDANHALNQLFVVGIAAGFVIGIGGSVAVQRILPSSFADPAVARQATTYLRIIFFGIHTMLLPGLASSAFSASGNTLLPVKVNIVGIGVNIVLDRILVLGWASPFSATGPLGFLGRIEVPQLGIAGAAYATILAQGVSTLIFLALLTRGRGDLRLKRRLMRPDWRLLWKALRIGGPAGAGQSLVALGFVIMIGMIGRLPNAAAALAGYGVADRIFGLLFIATDGLGVGLTTMVGQALGAGLLDRTRILVSKGIRALLVVVLVEAVILYFARRPLVGLFLPGKADAIREGTTFIALFAASMPFLCTFFAAEAIYRGAGRNVPVLVLGLIRLWGLRIPLSWLFAVLLGLGSTGVWLGMSASNVVSGIAAILWLRTGSWRRSRLAPEKAAPVADNR
ncbi:MAG: MATE family efflux transporter [Candidatus Bipolaricaulis sp.]|nr:MATE family efflux transporter [Candidatus Bipolaricaulis sp.]